MGSLKCKPLDFPHILESHINLHGNSWPFITPLGMWLLLLVASFSLTLLCVFWLRLSSPLGHESRFVVFLVAFCKRQGLYQSVVTQSVSCFGAGLVLTMLMTSLLLHCEALWFYLLKVDWALFSGSSHLSTGEPGACFDSCRIFTSQICGQFEVWITPHGKTLRYKYY